MTETKREFKAVESFFYFYGTCGSLFPSFLFTVYIHQELRAGYWSLEADHFPEQPELEKMYFPSRNRSLEKIIFWSRSQFLATKSALTLASILQPLPPYHIPLDLPLRTPSPLSLLLKITGSTAKNPICGRAEAIENFYLKSEPESESEENYLPGPELKTENDENYFPEQKRLEKIIFQS